MDIRISDLPYEGLKISTELPLEALNTRLNEGRPSDIVFTSPPKVEVTAFRRTEGGEIQGTVSTKYRQPCGRCSDEIERDLKVEANYILKPKPLEFSGNSNEADYVSDRGIVYFGDDHIDMESVIQESLIIALSIYWSPPEDKSGNCTICGKACASKVESTVGKASFGDLLKKAGLN